MQATDEREAVRNWRQQLWYALILCIVGVALNVLGSKIPGILGVPLYLDNIGTVIVATIGGYLPGVAMGYVSNLVNVAATDPGTAYYCIVTVLIAAACTWLQRKGFFDRWYRLPVVILVLAALGGGLGSILTWFLYGYGMGEGISAPYARMLYETGRLPLFWAQFLSDFFLDLIDKAVTVLISVVLMRFIPESIRRRCRMDGWRQTPLSEEERDAASRSYSRGASLRTKILTLIAAITLFIALVTTAICFYLYHNSTLAEHKQMGRTVAKLVASQIDGDR
ncbi:MAG: hypothetical protein IJT34_04500, partial [Butyrivibrio sp.]|nr:hypothetical protein [Butyrivibrio sp.]